jgi:hypothetical protein
VEGGKIDEWGKERGKGRTWTEKHLSGGLGQFEIEVWGRCEVDRRQINECGPVSVGRCILPATLPDWFLSGLRKTGQALIG